jgi:hypothetical protein
MRSFVRQRSEGASFTAYWETRDPGSGKRRQHSRGGFPTKRAAQRHLNTLVGKVTAGEWRPDQSVTVRQLLVDCSLPAQRSRGFTSVVDCVEPANGRDLLLPALGARVVSTLTPADVNALVEKMRNDKSAKGRSGLSARTTQIAVGNLKAATA